MVGFFWTSTFQKKKKKKKKKKRKRKPLWFMVKFTYHPQLYKECPKSIDTDTVYTKTEINNEGIN